jgi:hypothetical protein
MSIIQTAKEKLKKIQNSNICVAITLPRGKHILGQNREQSLFGKGKITRVGRYRVVGNRTLSGQFEPLTPKSLDSMSL